MAKVVNPAKLPARNIPIPGLKPPMWQFTPSDDGDPSEVDAFIKMVREIRDQAPAVHTDAK